MSVRRILLYACVVAIFVISLSFPLLADAAVKEKLDVVLVIDNSGSMGTTDPDGLRFRAASAFVGYLKLNEDKIDGRVGVVLFSGGSLFRPNATSPTGGLQPVTRDGDIRETIRILQHPNLRDFGFTDFPAALDKAYSCLTESETFDSDRKRAVILFTDGRPETYLSILLDILGLGGREQEFEKIQARVDRFKELGCPIYVIATGAALKDEQEWRNISIETGGLYFPLADIEQISLHYREILLKLTGVDFGEMLPLWSEEPTGQIREQTVNVWPYLRKVTFTLQKGKTNILMTIVDPDGKVIKPTDPNVIHTGGRNYYDEGYSIIRPKSGEWTIILEGQGSVSVWADRYALEIAIDEPKSYVVIGEPIPITAFLVDLTETFKTPVPSDPQYPLEFVANIRKGQKQDKKLIESLKLSPRDEARSIFDGTSREKASDGEYAIEVTAKTEEFPDFLVEKRRDGIIALGVPIIKEITIQPGQIGKTGSITVIFEYHDVVTPSTPLDVWAKITDANGTQYVEKIRLIQIPGTNTYMAPLGHVTPDGEVVPFGDSDPTGWYTVVIYTSYITSDGLKIERENEATFCVIARRENLPLPETLTFFDKDGRKQLNPNKLVVGERMLAQVAIKNFNKAIPETVKVETHVINPDGIALSPFALTRDPESNTFTGRLDPLSKKGPHTIRVSVSGKTVDGCVFPPGEARDYFDFTFTVVPWYVILGSQWWFWAAIGAIALAILSFLIWKVFMAPVVRPSVDGKVIITDPLGKESLPIDLYDQGARISIGSEGIVRLDPTLDSNVAGVVAELRARVVGRRRVVRSVWYKTGDKFEEGQEIYHGDEFSVGRFRLRYENLAAEREVISEILETE